MTAENYWQAGRPGIEPALKELFLRYGQDPQARAALLDIAAHSRMHVLRVVVLESYAWDYKRLLSEPVDLRYILALRQGEDFAALALALQSGATIPEARAAELLAELSWRGLNAKSISVVAAQQFFAGRRTFSVNWVLTHQVADAACDADLYRLTRSLLVRLLTSATSDLDDRKKCNAEESFVELDVDMLALVIERSATSAGRAACLCRVLDRFVRRRHHMHADIAKLQQALRGNREVRLRFLRQTIQASDGTANGIFRALYWYQNSMFPLVEGDDLALNHPGFSELVEARRKVEGNSPRAVASSRAKVVQMHPESKSSLSAMLWGIRGGSNEAALSWIAQWLRQASRSDHYSECDFATLARAAGEDIAAAVREGLSVLWRRKEPRYKEDEPNSVYYITVAGLQGLQLDLADGAQLPAMGSQEVERAIRYAQFEINGYPTWFWPLARAYEKVATLELAAILTRAGNGKTSSQQAERVIRHLNEAPDAIRHGLTSAVWAFVLANTGISGHTVESGLQVAAANPQALQQDVFEREAWNRISSSFEFEASSPSQGGDAPLAEQHKSHGMASQKEGPERANGVVWGCVWLCTYPDSFCRHWEEWRESNQHAADSFMYCLAAHLGEDRGATLRQIADLGSVGLDALKRLDGWVRLVVKEEEDVEHEGAYSPGPRDYAQQLREAIVPAIAQAKSERAYVVLDGLRQRATGQRAKYLRQVQFMMREEQFSPKSIAQRGYAEFERILSPPVSDHGTFAMAVHTDLLRIKNAIETGDFSLRRFFSSIDFGGLKTESARLALEEDFQVLLGSELNHAAAGRYVVTLEPILSDGTRRDVLCQFGALRATIELKMSERWTLVDYIEALEMQLQGQYMRDPNSRIGFFVVVLQRVRTWEGPTGEALGFAELIHILSAAARKRAESDSSLYLRVIGIDATQKEDFRTAKKRNRSAKKRAGATSG